MRGGGGSEQSTERLNGHSKMTKKWGGAGLRQREF